MKPILILGCVLMVLSVIITCGDDDDDNNSINDDNEDDDDNDTDDDDDNNNSIDDDNDDDTSTEEVWMDESTGLMWQVHWSSPGLWPWGGAVEHCENLVLDDYDDWRLPTISELRTLMYGCDVTETGGACNVTDACLSSSCENDACNGCDGYVGPNHGCYGNLALPGECEWFWSISEVEDSPTQAYYISYGTGGIFHYYKSSDSGSEYNARCVRDAK